MKNLNYFLNILDNEKFYNILNSKEDLINLSNEDFDKLFLKSVEYGFSNIVNFFLEDADFLVKINFFYDQFDNKVYTAPLTTAFGEYNLDMIELLVKHKFMYNFNDKDYIKSHFPDFFSILDFYIKKKDQSKFVYK